MKRLEPLETMLEALKVHNDAAEARRRAAPGGERQRDFGYIGCNHDFADILEIHLTNGCGYCRGCTAQLGLELSRRLYAEHEAWPVEKKVHVARLRAQYGRLMSRYSLNGPVDDSVVHFDDKGQPYVRV